VDEAVVIGDLDHGSVGPTERASPHSGPAGDGAQVGGQVEILGLERGEGENLMHRWQQLQPVSDRRDGAWNPSWHARWHRGDHARRGRALCNTRVVTKPSPNRSKVSR